MSADDTTQVLSSEKLKTAVSIVNGKSYIERTNEDYPESISMEAEVWKQIMSNKSLYSKLKDYLAPPKYCSYQRLPTSKSNFTQLGVDYAKEIADFDQNSLEDTSISITALYYEDLTQLGYSQLSQKLPQLHRDIQYKVLLKLLDFLEICSEYELQHGDLHPKNIYLKINPDNNQIEIKVADWESASIKPIINKKARHYNPSYLDPDSLASLILVGLRYYKDNNFDESIIQAIATKSENPKHFKPLLKWVLNKIGIATNIATAEINYDNFDYILYSLRKLYPNFTSAGIDAIPLLGEDIHLEELCNLLVNPYTFDLHYLLIYFSRILYISDKKNPWLGNYLKANPSIQRQPVISHINAVRKSILAQLQPEH